MVEIHSKPRGGIVTGTAIVTGEDMLCAFARCNLPVVAAIATSAANVVVIETTSNPGVGAMTISTITGCLNMVTGFVVYMAGIASARDIGMIDIGTRPSNCLVTFAAVLGGC